MKSDRERADRLRIVAGAAGVVSLFIAAGAMSYIGVPHKFQFIFLLLYGAAFFAGFRNLPRVIPVCANCGIDLSAINDSVEQQNQELRWCPACGKDVSVVTARKD
jgi:Zn finger protein HypA/HybF involved in hydrogenase expression